MSASWTWVFLCEENLVGIVQNIVCVLAVLAMRSFGLVYTEKFTWKLVCIWIPINVIFVGMLATSMFR